MNEQALPSFDQPLVDDLKRQLTPHEINKKIVDFWIRNMAEISINEFGSNVVADILGEVGKTPLINMKKGVNRIYDLMVQKTEKYDVFIGLMMRAKLLDHRITHSVLTGIYCREMVGLIGHKGFESFNPEKDNADLAFMDLFLLVLKVNIETVTIALPYALANGAEAALRALNERMRASSRQSSRR